ncbi:MAG: aminodeoxychorismate/anthranilate synthase component II [Proteobacteria bacterium]|jgi:anthranilate synthase/aminodeoxychorismate synthase-like glutamine amidotransferase|nr:aminodeoxychorismate/anthranilate synthase component II [Pseudomonadota bacterium]
MKILLIDNYDSFTFNLYHYISSLNTKVDVIRNDKITSKEIIKKKYEKIVISPGPGNPNQSGNCINILKTLHKELPFLGVCLGHQIIGQVFGSRIVQAKKLMHGKISLIKSKRVGILKNLPNSFEATRYHSLIIDKKTLSKDLEITAETDDGVIMGIQHKEFNIHGVQFHPESIKTKLGLKILQNFINN